MGSTPSTPTESRYLYDQLPRLVNNPGELFNLPPSSNENKSAIVARQLMYRSSSYWSVLSSVMNSGSVLQFKQIAPYITEEMVFMKIDSNWSLVESMLNYDNRLPFEKLDAVLPVCITATNKRPFDNNVYKLYKKNYHQMFDALQDRQRFGEAGLDFLAKYSFPDDQIINWLGEERIKFLLDNRNIDVYKTRLSESCLSVEFKHQIGVTINVTRMKDWCSNLKCVEDNHLEIISSFVSKNGVDDNDCVLTVLFENKNINTAGLEKLVKFLNIDTPTAIEAVIKRGRLSALICDAVVEIIIDPAFFKTASASTSTSIQTFLFDQAGINFESVVSDLRKKRRPAVEPIIAVDDVTVVSA